MVKFVANSKGWPIFSIYFILNLMFISVHIYLAHAQKSDGREEDR